MMKIKSQWTAVFILFLVFSSCTKQKEIAPKRTNTLRMNVIREPSTMDPRKGSEFIGSTFHFILFEGLTRLNTDYSVSPAQAKSIEISDDRKTYTFHLRGTQWSDGSPVIAADFETAWKKILTPDFPAANAPLLYPIKNAEEAKKGLVPIDEVGIHSIDDKTLVVELKNPTPYFLELVSFCVFSPIKHDLDASNPDWMNHAGENYICNGPFKLVSWKHNNEIVVEKNPFYWEKDLIPLEKIQVSMVKDENTVLKMYENGELDFLGTALSPIPNDVLLKYHQQGLLKSYSSAATTAISFNVTQYPFTSRHMRKAFSYSIDRRDIVDNITQLGEEVATQLIPTCLKHSPAHSYFKDHKIKKAKRHFAKGLKDLGITAEEFPTLTYDYSYSDLNHKLAQILQQQWARNLGVKIELQHCEHKVLLDKLVKRDYTFAQSFWFSQYHDPMSILERYKYQTNPKNFSNWENPDYIRLLEKTAFDSTIEERAKTLEAAEAIIMQEMPVTPLYHWKTVFMVKDYVTYEEFPPEHGFLEFIRMGIKQ
jgi:oligopeptide transport system substrate-binding protein